MFSLCINNPLSGLRVAFLDDFIGSYNTFLYIYIYIAKIGVSAPCRVSLLNSDKPIFPLNSDKNSRDQSVRIKRSRLYLVRINLFNRTIENFDILNVIAIL